MKKIPLLFILLPLFAHAQTQTLQYNGCQYQGEVAQGKPHGKGVLTCADGRIYTGGFAQGDFHGKGQFVSPNRTEPIYLAPFGLRSTQVKGMVLVGEFERGNAKGRFRVLQNGEHIYNMDFEKNILKSMSLPDKKGSLKTNKGQTK